MSFEQEWAALKATATANQHTRMRLNSAPASAGGGGGQRLHVTPSVLRHRAEKADIVRRDFLAADDKATKETGQVAASLAGFRSGPAFDVFKKRWTSQMDYVKGLLQNDVAGALRAAANDFEARDRAEGEKYRHGGKGGGRPGTSRDDGRV
ncbi:type VII secretion target [Streptomyces purpurogeneiscleroticus]|uniref:type VII secretion target n=1 Tax=Streptomyces purpurogeneiscleroticus TaxID=68259 RepID=UPI001CBFF3A2|nr:type VII secretion target [Streptomyces purpurogeneiscleroticus]